jgi:DGQHR domain-containing protein
MIESIGAVTVKRCSNLEEAQKGAYEEVANTGAFSIPVTAFPQGQRLNMSGAIPMSWLKFRLDTQSAKSAKAGGSIADSLKSGNRPMMHDHAEVISKYMLANFKHKYIIPPMTLNIQHEVNLYIPDYKAEFLPGYLVVPGNSALSITDGQHRREAIIQVLDEMSAEDAAQFGSDAVSVMITCETDLHQIHQDFADCSKTKPLNPSLLAVYDRRNPANRVVSDMEAMCPLFKGRIDPNSKTLGKKSTFLFLANQLRQLVKQLLTGVFALGDDQFEERAHQLLDDEDRYNDNLKKFVGYINYLTGFSQDASGEWKPDPSIRPIQVWNQIARLPLKSLQINQVPIIREANGGSICLTATGLNIIGNIGHRLIADGLLEDWQQYAQKLGDPQLVDWSKEAPMWQRSILQGKKIATTRGPVERAIRQVAYAIGLPGAEPLEPLPMEQVSAPEPELSEA